MSNQPDNSCGCFVIWLIVFLALFIIGFLLALLHAI
jgi:hypothetical protein